MFSSQEKGDVGIQEGGGNLFYGHPVSLQYRLNVFYLEFKLYPYNHIIDLFLLSNPQLYLYPHVYLFIACS